MRQPQQQLSSQPRDILTLKSHRLEDVTLFDDEGVVEDIHPASSSLGAAARAAELLTPVPPRTGPKPYADVPLPPPSRPLVWKTKLADRATAAVNLEARYQLSPHMLFELLADPTQHDKIFDAILAADSELLEESGSRRKWRLDYTARWNFWKVSGVCENRLFMWTDSKAGTVTFKLREPGFLKKYEGTWTISAGCGSPLAAFSNSNINSTATTAAAPGATAAAGTVIAPSPASSTYDLTTSSSSSSGIGSSRGSSPLSSPRSSWADGLPTAEMFGAQLSRGSGSSSASSGGSSSSAVSLRPLPLATVSPLATSAGGLPVSLGHTLSGAAATLGSSISGTLSRWLGYGTISNTTDAGAASQDSPWPPLFKPSADKSAGSSTSISSGGSWSLAAGEAATASPSTPQPVVRPMPTTALITASTLTSPKLTPPYPINQCLKVQSKGQVEEMLEGLVRAAAAQLQTQPLV